LVHNDLQNIFPFGFQALLPGILQQARGDLAPCPEAPYQRPDAEPAVQPIVGHRRELAQATRYRGPVQKQRFRADRISRAVAFHLAGKQHLLVRAELFSHLVRADFCMPAKLSLVRRVSQFFRTLFDGRNDLFFGQGFLQ
jgi:hypothetical protein